MVMRVSIRSVVVTAILVLTATPPGWAQAAPDPTGHWKGAVTAPMGAIEFEIDVSRSAAGSLTATYGQPATGLRGLPLSSITLDGRTLTLVLLDGGPGGAIFKGELLADGKSISGDATSPLGSAPFMITRTGDAHIDAPVRNAPVSQALEGRWTGTLDTGGRQLTLILTIENRDGSASAFLAQADRALLHLPATLKEDGTKVTFDVKAASGSFAGTRSASWMELSGAWTQMGASLPITFRK
jgi:hypothetical protein